ncbi:MAG: hypothetical protein QG583_552 [Patescibacteria group bacterium]|nr:hypothetical protein [Patescibacteria group bacterium]
MNVYFIRHGKSIYNNDTFESKIHQPANTPLSEIGVDQAKALADRFSQIPLDLILCSTYPRAIQTAAEIEKMNVVPLLQSDLFIERKMPSSFDGKAVEDPEIVPIHNTIREHFDEVGFHYSDEENYHDLINRAKKALRFIISQEKENIVVVTHGYFINVLITYLLFEENSTLPILRSLIKHTDYSNTGITTCRYADNLWQVLTINDYTHLKE